MNTAWIVVIVVLACSQVVLAVYVLGLSTQISQLTDRIPRDFASLDPVGAALAVGSSTPDLPHTDPNFASSPSLVIFSGTDCSSCHVLAEDLDTDPVQAPGVTLLLVSDEADPHSEILASRGWRTLSDDDGKAFESWKVTGTPLAYAINDHRVIAVAIPNTSRDVRRLVAQFARRVVNRRRREGKREGEDKLMDIDRRRFLSRAVRTVGAGAGIVLLQSNAAKAALPPPQTVCCHSNATQCATCQGAPLKYNCTNYCRGTSYCTCHSDVGTDCYTLDCA